MTFAYTPIVTNDSLLREATEFDFPSKLRANAYPFDPSSNAQVVGLTSRLDLELEKYDKEIDHLSKALNTLREEREKFIAHCHHAHSLLSPIRKLPNDILTEIFAYTIAGQPNFFTSIRITIPIHTVSHVCISWRRLVDAVGSFWAKIQIVESRHDSADVLDWILDKSGASPLDITIFLLPSNAHSTFQELVVPLIRQCQRYRSFSYTYLHRGKLSLQDLQHCYHMKDRVDSLKSLSLEYADAFEFDATAFANAPSLTEVALKTGRHESSPWQKLVPTLPWEQLDTLRLRTDYQEEMCFILSQCCNLKAMGLSLTYPGESRTLNPLTMPTVERLYIMTDVLFFSRYLVLPSLNHLELYFYDRIDLKPLKASVNNIFKHSKPSFTSLSLVVERLSRMPNPVDLLKSFHWLTSLSLCDHTTDINYTLNYNDRDWLVSSRILKALQRVDSPKLLLPKLKNLTLQKFNPNIDHALIISLLERRYNNQPASPFACLERVELEFIQSVGREIVEKYGPLVERGLNLFISGDNSPGSYYI